MNIIKTTPNTVLVGTKLSIKSLLAAKRYLKDNFSNKYDAEPHLNFVIMAMPIHKLKELEVTLDEYFSIKTSIKLQLGNLHYDPTNKFFSIPLLNESIIDTHKELLGVLNPVRDNYSREEDLLRINEKRTDAKGEQYIYEYGYLRVLDKFIPHITIGNIQKEDVNIEEVKTKLNEILGSLYNSTIDASKIYATFIEDADIQSDYKFLWEKEYILN